MTPVHDVFQTPRPKSGPWIGILAVVFLIIIVISFLLPGVHSGPVGNWTLCAMNLKNLAFALLEYEKDHGCLPPAYTTDANGKPLHSWRTLLLPYLDQEVRFNRLRLDEPWDSPHNQPLLHITQSVFSCPCDTNAGPYDTSYVAVLGPDTVWKVNQGVKPAEITDGPQNTILLVELKHSGIAWSEPRDLDLDHLPPGIDKNKLLEALAIDLGKNVIQVAFADGSFRVLPLDLPLSDFMALLTKSGGEEVDQSKW